MHRVYFWNVRNLVKLLGERELTEGEAFRYFFANLVLITAFAEMPTPDWNVWDTVSSVAGVVFTILGLLYCFRSNGGAGGREFLPRFSALLWVVTIRTLVLAIPAMFAIMAAADFAGAMTEATSWWEVPLVIAIEAIIYLRVAVHLRTVNALRRQYAEWQARRETAAETATASSPC